MAWALLSKFKPLTLFPRSTVCSVLWFTSDFEMLSVSRTSLVGFRLLTYKQSTLTS